MITWPVSRYLRAHCDRHALSYLSRLAPGLDTHLSKHTSASFATTCGWFEWEFQWGRSAIASSGFGNPSKRVEIEAMGMRRTSLNIALRFSSSRKDAICGSMPCWGAMSNRNPRVTRSD